MNSTAKMCNPGNADRFFRTSTMQAAADELCFDCPLMFQCRDIGRNEGHLHGVWGGEMPEDRMTWLIDNHPDPDVRASAETERRRLERQRESSRVAKANRRALVRARMADAPRVPTPVREQGELTLNQHRAAQLAAKARQMVASGFTPAEIAEELGASRRSIQRYLYNAKYDNIAA